METTPKTKEEIQAKINQLKEEGVADEQAFIKAVDNLTNEEKSIQDEIVNTIHKLNLEKHNKNETKETHEEIASKLSIPEELPGLAEAQAELNKKKEQKEAFLALVKEYKELKASYEAKMARIAELDKIIEANKNNPETNMEELPDEELERREQELEEKIKKERNKTPETQDIERRRQEEVDNAIIVNAEKVGGSTFPTEEVDKINAKYDEELAALENTNHDKTKPFIPEGEHSFTPEKTSHINEKGEEFKLGDEVYVTPAQGNKPVYEYLGKITGFSNNYAFTTLQNNSTDKRPINTDVLVKKVPEGMEIIGK